MRVCRVKVRIEPEDAYWQGQMRRVQRVDAAIRKRKPVRVRGAELVFASLTDMARALTPKRLETLRLIRRHEPSSVRQLAEIAGRDIKNVLADVKALDTLGLIQTEGTGNERQRKAPRSAFDRIDVQLEL